MSTTPTTPTVPTRRRPSPVRRLALLAGLVLAGPAPAAEGMWTLDHLPHEAMRSRYGFAPDEAWVRHATQSSLRLSNGCFGAFVSPDGLVLTNHHCVAACVEQLSRAGQDRLADGFLARERAAELRCPEIELLRLDAITDVTDELRRATAGRSASTSSAPTTSRAATRAARCSTAPAGWSAWCSTATVYDAGVLADEFAGRPQP